MSTPNDGGAAFPLQIHVSPGSEIQSGMSLRDYFAGQALAGLLASHHYDSTAKGVAEYAYEHADAMLAARGGSKS